MLVIHTCMYMLNASILVAKFKLSHDYLLVCVSYYKYISIYIGGSERKGSRNFPEESVYTFFWFNYYSSPQ